MKSIYIGMVLLASSLLSYGQVTYERLLNADDEPEHWLSYSGAYHSRRFSNLDQINRRERQGSRAEMGLPVRVTGEVSGHSARGGWRDVSDATAQRHLRSGRPDRTDILDLHTQPTQKGQRLLRPGEPRPGDPRRHTVHGHRRRPSHGLRLENRCGEVGCGGWPIPPAVTRLPWPR